MPKIFVLYLQEEDQKFEKNLKKINNKSLLEITIIA